ncbi:hydrolase 1, exosortase A system-associated [Haliea sp.]|jgi:exosortase A-associated hydrolase 1|uniref:hydrolase 1, exosortase A system-associated n=1 Tax=Haliea sp. TaxID=1932666 RepID=UPI003527DF08
MNTGQPTREIAFSFELDESTLIGVIHESSTPSDLGVLTIVAGGPQYRGGCGRQLVALGRRLSQEGVHVMRFDHRGLGDSEGEFQGFEALHDDIASAIAEFHRRVPGLARIILWGGCDAASAALMSAYRFPEVVSIVAANPWVSSERTAARVQQKHYLSRLRQCSFWRKLFRMEYDIASYLRGAFAKLHSRLARRDGADAGPSTASMQAHYIERMLRGLQQFDGSVLFLMSGHSLISREFDELVASDREWNGACNGEGRERREVPGADQTFSSAQARSQMLDAASSWARRFKLP